MEAIGIIFILAVTYIVLGAMFYSQILVEIVDGDPPFSFGSVVIEKFCSYSGWNEFFATVLWPITCIVWLVGGVAWIIYCAALFVFFLVTGK